MERSLRFAGAVVAASILAGPFFWLSFVLLDLAFGGTAGIGETGSFAHLIIPVGAYFAFLPNLIGTMVMTMLGNTRRSARSPYAWIAAGAVGAVMVAVILTGASVSELPLLAAMILTGISCAAVCRAFTRWPEETGQVQA